MTDAQAKLMSAAIIVAGAAIALAVGIQTIAGAAEATPIPGVVAAIAGLILGIIALTEMKKDDCRGG